MSKPIYKTALPVPPPVNNMFQAGNKNHKGFYRKPRYELWQKDAAKQLKLAPKLESVSYHYVFYPKNKTFGDLENYLKGVTDALVKAGVIQDDKHTILKKGSFEFGGYDKENPRVEIFLYSNAHYPDGYTPQTAPNLEHLVRLRDGH